jgi:hypothetical protein
MKKTITASELAAEQSGEEGVSVGVGVSVIRNAAAGSTLATIAFN